MTNDQLRRALKGLNGERDVTVHFLHGDDCHVHRAMLIPSEEDQLVKLTDGRHEYVLDADRINWIRIG